MIPNLTQWWNMDTLEDVQSESNRMEWMLYALKQVTTFCQLRLVSEFRSPSRQAGASPNSVWPYIALVGSFVLLDFLSFISNEVNTASVQHGRATWRDQQPTYTQEGKANWQAGRQLDWQWIFNYSLFSVLLPHSSFIYLLGRGEWALPLVLRRLYSIVQVGCQ